MTEILFARKDDVDASAALTYSQAAAASAASAATSAASFVLTVQTDRAGTTDTLVSGDSGSEIPYTATSAITVNLPDTLPRGFIVSVLQKNAGGVITPVLTGNSTCLQGASLTAFATNGPGRSIGIEVVKNVDGSHAEYAIKGPNPGPTGAQGTSGAGFLASSASSLTTAASGTISGTMSTDLAYTANARLSFVNTASGDEFQGVLASYTPSSGAFSLTADYTNNTGQTHASWTINPAGVRGVAGGGAPANLTLTNPASPATFTLAGGKTATWSNTLTFAGTDGSSIAFGTGGTVAYTANKLSVFASTTSAELAGVISNETGSGLLVFATSPTLTTPVLGVATATSINKVAITAPSSSATLTIADGKTLTVNQTITLAGTDAQTYTFPTTSATIARTDAANTFTGHQTIEGVTSTGATGTGNLVFSSSPTLVTPTLGAATATTVTIGAGSAITSSGAGGALGSNAFTSTSIPAAANPTATGADTAVNGSASTYMRSDGAPAIQKGSSSLFGVVKVDNVTITASSGVIAKANGQLVNANIALGNQSTTSATAVMGGYGTTAKITPSTTGKVFVIMRGVGLPGVASNPSIRLQRGTGTAPSSGDAITGTQLSQDYVLTTSGMIVMTAAMSLTVGTAYWFDTAMLSDGVNTAQFQKIEFEAIEF